MDPARARVLAFLLALLVALLAGCVRKPEPAPATAAPTTTAQTTTLAAQANATVPVHPIAVPATPFPLEYQLDHCLNPRMLFFLDPAVAQANLPPGYHAADATGLLRYVGFPQPPAIATGKAVAGYDFLTCNGNSLGGPAAFSEVGIFIDPPKIADANATAVPTNLDLYLLAVHTDSPQWQALMRAGGFTPDESQLLIANGRQTGLAAYQGAGRVVGTNVLATAQWAGGNAEALSVHARYWHSTAAGTFFLDFKLDESVYAGAILSCTHAPGSAYAKATGTASCGQEPRFAAIGMNSTIAGGLHWLPGLQPT